MNPPAHGPAAKAEGPIVWPAGPAVQLTRRFPDDPATLFRAFTDPVALRQWWGPRGFTITGIDFPAVEGRAYRVTLQAPDGSQWAHEGHFLRVRAPEELSYTWTWVEGPLPPVDTLVELTFAADGSGTRLSVRHGAFGNQAECDQHLLGWSDSFERAEIWLTDLRQT
jgi:uncharacterized protein YndB with AHSA1/START domain